MIYSPQDAGSVKDPGIVGEATAVGDETVVDDAVGNALSSIPSANNPDIRVASSSLMGHGT